MPAQVMRCVASARKLPSIQPWLITQHETTLALAVLAVQLAVYVPTLYAAVSCLSLALIS